MSGIVPVGGGGLNPNSIKADIERNSPTDAAKIEKVGQQFEAILLRQYLGDALKPMFKGYIDEGGSINDQYRYFITDILANSLSSDGGLGMGSQLSNQINSGLPSATSSAVESQIDSKKMSKMELSGDIRSLNTLSKINGTANAKQ